MAVACDVFIDVSLCCPFSPRDVLDGICDLIGSVSEGFPTYFFIQASTLAVVARVSCFDNQAKEGLCPKTSVAKRRLHKKHICVKFDILYARLKILKPFFFAIFPSEVNGIITLP